MVRIPLALRYVAAAAFASQFAALDVVFSGRVRPACAVSVALWTCVLLVATTRRRRIAVAILASFVAVVQISVFRAYRVPLDVQVAASAIHAWGDVRAVLVRSIPWLGGSIALGTALELAVLSIAPPLPRLRPAYAAVPAFAGLLVVPPREGTPEVRAAYALTALRDRREPPRVGAEPLPALHSSRPAIPNVLFILNESIRADTYSAETAPKTAEVTKGRVDLAEMRAVASYTAVSLSAILSGRTQEVPREEILRSPHLFDLVRAARDAQGRRPKIAYIASQWSTIFETKDISAPADMIATIEDFQSREDEVTDLGDRGGDRFAVEHLEKHVGELGAPAFVFLHLNDTHIPYTFDPKLAPFQPAEHAYGFAGMPKLYNAYKDAIFLQDRAIARAITAFVKDAEQKHVPWLIVFTSDHGDAFGEHGAIHHGQNLYDEQVHVPGWILGGNGALSKAEEQALADHHGRFVTHLDLLPTVLDAMGLWDNFSLAKHRANMRGKSLLRPFEPRGAIPVTNCTVMFPCPTNTWGYYDDDHKLLARIYDSSWVCHVVKDGGDRLVWDDTCARLVGETKKVFPELPNGQPNR